MSQDSGPRFDPATDVDNTTTRPPPYALSSTLSTGDPIVYSSGGGAPIGGLQDGGTYYVIDHDRPFKPLPRRTTRMAGTFIHVDSIPATGARTASSSRATCRPVTRRLPARGDRPPAGSRGFRVAVTAMNSDDIAAVGASVGVGGSAGVAVAARST